MNTTMEISTCTKTTTTYRNCTVETIFRLSDGIRSYDAKGNYIYSFKTKTLKSVIITPNYAKQLNVRVTDTKDINELIDAIQWACTLIHFAVKAEGYLSTDGNPIVKLFVPMEQISSKEKGIESFFLGLNSQKGIYTLGSTEAKRVRRLGVSTDTSMSKKLWNITDWLYRL